MTRRLRTFLSRSGLAAVVLLSAVPLTACQTTDEHTLPEVSSASQTEIDTVADNQEVAAVPTITPPEPEPEPEPIPVPDPETLIGYDNRALEGLLGLPSFTRQDPPAELWQYRNDVCTLDLFLYETASGGHSVEHYEFRETGKSREAAEQCLRSIIEKRLASASSA